MWKIYGHCGAAIRTNLAKLETALKQSDRDFIYRRMEYVSFPDRAGCFAGHDSLIQHPYFLKRKEYGSEKEIRFVTAAPEVANRAGITLRLQPQEWIQEVVLCPELPSKAVNSLKQTIEGVAPGLKCYQSTLLEERLHPASVTHIHFPDDFALANRAWQNDTDATPPMLKRLYIEPNS